MPFPSFLLGFVIASLYGAVFHLLRGGGPGRIFFYLLLAWIGFFSGHFIAAWGGWILLPIGPLNAGIGTLGALIFLIIGNWLGNIDSK